MNRQVRPSGSETIVHLTTWIQAQKLMHGSNLYHNEWSGELAQLLVESTYQHGGLGFSPSSPAGSAGLKVFFASKLKFLLSYRSHFLTCIPRFGHRSQRRSSEVCTQGGKVSSVQARGRLLCQRLPWTHFRCSERDVARKIPSTVCTTCSRLQDWKTERCRGLERSGNRHDLRSHH
jgi:hypothetical protein